MAEAVTITVALIAVLGTLGNAYYTNRVAQKIAEQTKADTAAQIAARYRDPLLRASFDLQSRMYNIVEHGFIEKYYGDERPDTTEYACENTLFVLAEYLGWVEILRREVRFLDLGKQDRNEVWANSQVRVRKVLQAEQHDGVLQVMNGQQRAIGEVMIEEAGDGPDGTSRQQTIGYAEFVARRRADAQFSRWFERLEQDIALLAREPGHHHDRLIALQRALIDMIDCLDPEYERLPKAERGKLPELTPRPAQSAPPAPTSA